MDEEPKKSTLDTPDKSMRKTQDLLQYLKNGAANCELREVHLVHLALWQDEVLWLVKVVSQQLELMEREATIREQPPK